MEIEKFRGTIIKVALFPRVMRNKVVLFPMHLLLFLFLKAKEYIRNKFHDGMEYYFFYTLNFVSGIFGFEFFFRVMSNTIKFGVWI